jgi:hypothetical protein
MYSMIVSGFKGIFGGFVMHYFFADEMARSNSGEIDKWARLARKKVKSPQETNPCQPKPL